MAENFFERESFFGICTNHSSNEQLSLGRHEMGNVVNSSFYFFEKSSKIIIVEWKRSNLKFSD